MSLQLNIQYASEEEKNLPTENDFTSWVEAVLNYFDSKDFELTIRMIDKEEMQKIGDKIWQNEGGRKYENLTCWNKGENFASLGIGHFIWYPEQEKEIYKQTFPTLLNFLRSRGILWFS